MTTYSKTTLAALLITLLSVSACGETKGDRALSGAGIGAGVGTVGTMITGGNPWTGAAVGAAAGAAAGALTDKKDLDMGKPAWRR